MSVGQKFVIWLIIGKHCVLLSCLCVLLITSNTDLGSCKLHLKGTCKLQPGMCHTVIWNAQYSKIRVKRRNTRIIRSYFSSNLGAPIFDPKSPETFPNLFQYITCYESIILWHCKLAERPFLGRKMPKWPKIGRNRQILQSLNTAHFLDTVIYALNVIGVLCEYAVW